MFFIGAVLVDFRIIGTILVDDKPRFQKLELLQITEVVPHKMKIFFDNNLYVFPQEH